MRAIPCKMKLKVESQIAEHEIKPVFIGSYTLKVSGNSSFYAAALGFPFFLRHIIRDFVLESKL